MLAIRQLLLRENKADSFSFALLAPLFHMRRATFFIFKISLAIGINNLMQLMGRIDPREVHFELHPGWYIDPRATPAE